MFPDYSWTKNDDFGSVGISLTLKSVLWIQDFVFTVFKGWYDTSGAKCECPDATFIYWISILNLCDIFLKVWPVYIESMGVGIPWLGKSISSNLSFKNRTVEADVHCSVKLETISV